MAVSEAIFWPIRGWRKENYNFWLRWILSRDFNFCVRRQGAGAEREGVECRRWRARQRVLQVDDRGQCCLVIVSTTVLILRLYYVNISPTSFIRSSNPIKLRSKNRNKSKMSTWRTQWHKSPKQRSDNSTMSEDSSQQSSFTIPLKHD